MGFGKILYNSKFLEELKDDEEYEYAYGEAFKELENIRLVELPQFERSYYVAESHHFEGLRDDDLQDIPTYVLSFHRKYAYAGTTKTYVASEWIRVEYDQEA
jgi:hypothetical protein